MVVDTLENKPLHGPTVLTKVKDFQTLAPRSRRETDHFENRCL